jgi:hypothetical protein
MARRTWRYKGNTSICNGVPTGSPSSKHGCLNGFENPQHSKIVNVIAVRLFVFISILPEFRLRNIYSIYLYLLLAQMAWNSQTEYL